MAVLGVAWASILYLQSGPSKNFAAATPAPTETAWLASSKGEPVQVTLSSGATVVQFGRNEQGIWVLELPEITAADQASAEAAVTQLGALRVLEQVSIDPVQAGLSTPEYEIQLKYRDSTSENIGVGNLNAIGTAYYARIGSSSIVLVGRDGLDVVLGLLKNPPYAATAEPTAGAPIPSNGTVEAPTITATP